MKKILLSLAVSLGLQATAQTWTHYPVYGLVNNIVNSITIDSQGNKWFGTNGGVSKFDGVNWTSYTSGNTYGGLVSNTVTSIAIDKEGNKWFGTNNGVSKFDGSHWTTYTQANTGNGLISNSVNVIAIDSSGNKWFGTSSGVSKFDGTSWETFTQAIQVRSIVVDPKGDVWFGTPSFNGVYKFNGTNLTNYYGENGATTGGIYSIAIDKLGNKWFATPFGISKFDGTSWAKYVSNPSITSSFQTIAIDNNGNKWVGSNLGGVYKFDDTDTSWTRADTIQELNFVKTIVIDKEGNKWIGVSSGVALGVSIVIYEGGVSKLSGSSWTNYTQANTYKGLANGSITSIITDKQGNKWIGTQGGGVSKFDGKNLSTYTTNNSGIAGNIVRDIAIDEQGDIWFGIFDFGVSKFDGSNWTTYAKFNTNNGKDSLASIFVSSIAIDGKNNKWIGNQFITQLYADGGICEFNGTNWTIYNSQNTKNGQDSLISNYVNKIAIDEQDNKWIATSTQTGIALVNGKQTTINKIGGISKFDGIKWTSFNSHSTQNGQDSLASNYVYAIAIDKQGNKWFGTSNGVSKFDDTNWKLFNATNTSNGLVSNVINSIAVDTLDNKWFATNSGVSKFDGTTWTTYTQSNTNNGLASNSVRTISIAKNGDKWFGTYDNGISVLSGDVPTGLEENSFVAASIQISPNPAKDKLWVQTGLTNAKAQIYSLQGQKLQETVLQGTNSELDITNLKPGLYLLRVDNGSKQQSFRLVKEE